MPDISSYTLLVIICDQTHLFDNQAKSLIQGHDDQALLHSYFDLWVKSPHLLHSQAIDIVKQEHPRSLFNSYNLTIINSCYK